MPKTSKGLETNVQQFFIEYVLNMKDADDADDAG
jgi:hypothetical protein